MLDVLRRLFAKPAKTTEEPYASLPWLSAQQSPFGVKTLDLSITAEGLEPTLPDDETRRTIASWPGRSGAAFDLAEVSGPTFACDLRYALDGPLPDGPLFLPRAKEEKWALFHRQGRLLLVRSWTAEVVAIAPLSITPDHLTISTIHGDPTGGDAANDDALPGRVLDFLLRSHALGEIRPAPLPANLRPDRKTIALWCFKQFGRRALAASPEPPTDGPAQRPLRADSALTLAIISQKRHRIRQEIAAGTDLGARGTWHGYTPLHCAAATGQPEVISDLLRAGASLETLDDRGLTPLAALVEAAEPGEEGAWDAAAAALIGAGADRTARIEGRHLAEVATDNKMRGLADLLQLP